MPLRAELSQYAKREGINPAQFTHEITVYKKQRKEERKARRRSPLQLGMEAVNTVSRKSVSGFFDGLTAIRTHTPGAVKLFPWEKWYFNEYPDAGDPKKRKTWKELKEKEIDARQMFVLYLQDRYVVSEKMLLNLADQATTEENRNSWVFFNKDTQRVIGDWVDHEWPTAISHGIGKGLMSVVPQHPGVDALYFLGGGAAASKAGSELQTSRGAILNHINRMGSEFALLLKAHYLSHQRSLAGFREFSEGEINEISQRMFLGSRYEFETAMVKRDAKGIALGVALSQIAQDSASGSFSNALINLLGPAVAAAYLYRKIRKERSGKAVEHYIDIQTALLDEVDKASKTISSQRGRGISVDLEETGIPQKREELVQEMLQSQRRTFSPLEQTPLWLAAGTTAYDIGHFTQLAPGAQSLVTGGIIVAALAPFTEEFTRRRMAEVKNREIKRVMQMIRAINTAEHRVPHFIEFSGDMNIARAEALERMVGPLVINQLSTGSEKRTASVAEPIVLEPGVSFVKARSGRGKSALLRMIALEQGDINNISITKGIDLRSIDPRDLAEVVYHVEAQPHSSNLTIAEQMKPFLKDKELNDFNKAFRDPLDIVVHAADLARKYGVEKSMVQRLIENISYRDDLITDWIEDPLGSSYDSVESKIACDLLTNRFHQLVLNLFIDIRTIENTAEYLLRKPGAHLGTSTGEAKRFELLKAFIKQRAVILLDEPTGNLEDENAGDILQFRGIVKKKTDDDPKHSFYLVEMAIVEYMRKYPESVILVASNDGKLERRLGTWHTLRNKLRKAIYIEDEEDNQNLVWRAAPLPKNYL